MVNSNWTFTITHYAKDNSWASTNITADSFPRYFTDTGGEKVNAAKIRIIAVNGQYIQNNVNSKPQIKHNDRIRIQATDGSNGTYNKVFDVVKIIPIKSKTEGVMVELELLGLERWLQKCNYSARVFAETPKDIFKELVDAYIENRATNTPTINLSGSPPDITVNEIPDTITIHLDWGNNEDTIFNRMQELVDKMSAPQASGGVLDFYDIRFTYHASNVTSFNIEVFTSGNSQRTKPSVTLNSTDINTEDTAGGFEEPQGLLVNNWGANGAGSLPTGWSKFKGKQMIMPESLGSKTLWAEWDSAFTYTQNAIVKYTAGSVDKVYKAKRETIGDQPNTSSSDWEEITIDDYYDGQTYSALTDGQSSAWESSMANPSAGSGGGFGAKKVMWDANIILNDDNSFRTWADVIATSPSVVTSSKTGWLYGGTTIYDGFRVFVKGTGSGDFSSFSNCIVEYDNGDWIRKYELKDYMMISVLEDAKVWRYDGSGSYTDFSTVDNGLDCFHPLQSTGGTLLNSTSSIQNKETLSGGNPTNFTGNVDSSIEARFRWTPLENWTQEWVDIILTALGVLGTAVRYSFPLATGGGIATARTSDSWYGAGVWLCLRFPFPKNNLPAGSSALGSLYGGSTSEEIVPHLDFENMTYTSDGKRGFNQGSSSEDLGPLDSINFNMKIQYLANIAATSALQQLQKESFPMSCVLIDRNDNVVIQKFTVSFNNVWEAVTLPLNGFELYRGRKPMYKDGFFTQWIIPPKERPSFNQFEWRHIAMMCIQSDDSYDDNGRYRGASGNDWGTGSAIYNSQTMTFLESRIYLDALRFSKPLLVNSGQVTDLNNEPDFVQSPDIFIYESLKQNVESELQKAKFKNKRYDISTQGEFNIEFGDYFVLKDEDIVDETYTPSGGSAQPNQILLVAKHIEYEFSKPTNGSGGFERRLLGAKRFT